MATATGPELLARMLQGSIDEFLGPTIDAWNSIRDAADETADDAALGARAREVIATWARGRIDAEVARERRAAELEDEATILRRRTSADR